jgi:hypothetical protein
MSTEAILVQQVVRFLFRILEVTGAGHYLEAGCPFFLSRYKQMLLQQFKYATSTYFRSLLNTSWTSMLYSAF